MGMIRETLRLLLLVGLLCLPASLIFAMGYDTPVNVNAAEVTAKLAAMKNNLFFLGLFTDSARVEFDDFLIPNGSFAQLDYKWSKLINAAGKNILRAPTAEEKSQDNEFFPDPRVYATVANPTLSHAEGKATVRIPCAFAHVEFTPDELDVTKTADPLTVTLKRCAGNAVVLTLNWTGNREKPVVILRDAAGASLSIPSSRQWLNPDRDNSFFADGIIAKVEVFYPTQFATVTLDIKAYAEPGVVKVSSPVVLKSTRYLLKSTRYQRPEPSREGATLSPDAVKAQTSVVAGRLDTWEDYNRSAIALKLPRVWNSAFTLVDINKPQYFDAGGKAMTGTTEPEIFDYDNYVQEYRLRNLQEFARATGTVNIHYPATVKTYVLTPAKPRIGAIGVQFRGAALLIAGLPEGENGFVGEYPVIVNAYDATGRRLRYLNCFLGNSETRDKVKWFHYGFWGTPVEVHVTIAGGWLPFSIPFDLTPAPKLPANLVIEEE